jgi:Zinc finger, ZZ type
MFCTALGSSSSPEDWRNFDVQIESYDKDGDIISLHTEGDFHLLHSYMPHDRFIKVHATVTAPQLSPTVDTVLDSSASVATQTLEKDLTKSEDKDDQKIVNAIADLFSIAALSMKAGVTAAKHEIDVVKKTSENNIKGVRKLSKDSLKVAKKLSKESFKQVRNVLKNGTDCAAGSPLPHKSSPAESSPPHDSTHLPTAETPVVPNKIEVEPTPEPPFIHGRHTCDQCLTTPVIGKRFHALNLPDYDLCESCYGNYKGTEIVFEDVRLGKFQSVALLFVTIILGWSDHS